MKLKQILKESNKEAFNRSLTSEEKKSIMDAVSKFNDFGAKVYKTNEIKDMVEAIKNMTKGASTLALQETGDWFDAVTVKRDMSEVNKSTKLFEKAAKELSTLQQRLESVFEDIGHKLGKYYDISEALDPVGKEDGDIDNDGDEDESDEYLAKKRAAITKAIKNETKLSEAAPKMKTSKETENIKKVYLATSGLKKAGGSGRYGKEFEAAKKKALKAMNDMLTYSRIGG
tara:strand:+ start:8820 stop:9506 length:687 start_codon:yes stop_codon:yes gene_type:complete